MPFSFSLASHYHLAIKKSVRTFLASCIPCRKLRFCHCLIDFFFFLHHLRNFPLPRPDHSIRTVLLGIPSTSQRIEQAPFSADHREIFFHFLNIFLKMFSDIIQISFHCLFRSHLPLQPSDTDGYLLRYLHGFPHIFCHRFIDHFTSP